MTLKTIESSHFILLFLFALVQKQTETNKASSIEILFFTVFVIVVKAAAVVLNSNKRSRLTTLVLQLTSVDVLPTVVAAEQLERTQIRRLIRLTIQADGIVIFVLRLKAYLGRLAQALRALPVQPTGTTIG